MCAFVCVVCASKMTKSPIFSPTTPKRIVQDAEQLVGKTRFSSQLWLVVASKSVEIKLLSSVTVFVQTVYRFPSPFIFIFGFFSSENCDTGSAKNVTEYEAALPRAAVYVVRQRCEFVNDCIFTPLYLSRLSSHLFWTFFISSS